MSRKTDPKKQYKKLKKEHLRLWGEKALYEDTLKLVLDDPRTKEIAEDIYNKLGKLLPALDRQQEIMKLEEVLGE